MNDSLMVFCTLLLLLVVVSHELVSAFQYPAKTSLTRTLPAFQSTLFATSSPTDNKKTFNIQSVIVVGGGPVGLATALTLSNPPHSYDVTVVEAAPKASGYDPTKAYLYLVNPRGQVWTKRFPHVQSLLSERGSQNSGMGNLVLVPADPAEPVPTKMAEAKTQNSTANTKEEQSYWIPRHSMVELLEEAIEKQQQDSEADVGQVTILPNQECQSLKPLPNGQIQVTTLDLVDKNAPFERTFVGDLIVGADGMNSAVRSYLHHQPAEEIQSNWLLNTQVARKFRIKSWASAASNLRMKVLQFPPNFVIPSVNDTQIVTTSETTYAIRGKYTGPYNYVSLGLLPVKDPNMIRPTNVITRPKHDVWKLENGADAKEWFCQAFPRLKLESIIDDPEWDRFAKAKGTSFPRTTYCTGMQVTSPTHNTGVVLVGDAIHSFPPDIGQGINAGLADVETLDRALTGKNLITGEKASEQQLQQPSTLSQALEKYEQNRIPEVKALIRLSRFGSPYQYRQPQYRDRLGRKLWTLNVAFRLLLNKLSFGLIPPACIMNAMNRQMTYRKIMRQSDVTTLVLWSVLGVVAKRLVGTGGTVALAALASLLWYITYWFG